MYSVNVAHFFIITLLFLSSTCCATSLSLDPLIGIFPLTIIYIYIYIYILHKFDLITEVSNLTWLLLLYVPCDLSFVSTQFFVANLDGHFLYCVIILLFFDAPLLYIIIVVIIIIILILDHQ